MMPNRLLLASLLMLAAGTASAEPSPIIGIYRAQAGPDTASMLELAEDGHFRYQLSEGAVDEYAEGAWRATTSGAELETLPHPKAAEYSLRQVAPVKDTRFWLHVIGPNGDGVAAIDFRLGFTNGEVLEDYTQSYAWTLDADDLRQPEWIELSEPFFGTKSPRFPLPADRNAMAVTVTLTPNDLGVAPFAQTQVTLTPGGVVLHWRGRDIPYGRMEKGKDDDE
jgi:hypothetical protein